MSDDIVKKSEEIVKPTVESAETPAEQDTIPENNEKAAQSEDVSSEHVNTSEETNNPEEKSELIRSDITQDDKTMGMLAHLLGIFTMFVGPLVIWLTKKDTSTFVEEEAKEALNFQISLIIYYSVLTVVASVLTVVTLGLFGMIAPLAYPALGVFALIVMIMGTLQAKEGNHYKYPLCIRIIK